MSRYTVVATALVMCSAPAPHLRADEKSAREHLRSAGLRPVGSYFILPAEKELGEQLKTTEPLKKQLAQALDQQKACEQNIGNAKEMLHNAVQERRRLTLMLLQSRSEKEMMQIGARLLEVSDRIKLLSDRVNDSTESRAINRRVAEASDAYTRKLLDLRALADEAKRRYEALADDPKTQAALDELRRETGRRISLGPRIIFGKYVRDLQRLEADITTTVINLRPDQGVLWVDTSINERVNQAMVLDTGASLVSIPLDLARQIGLQPSEDHPTIKMKIADGRTVEGRLMSLGSLRVGRFTVKDVDCVVLSAEMSDAPALLGGSFLRHFTYTINHDANRLTLTRVKASSEGPEPGS